MNSVDPDKERLPVILAAIPDDRPVVKLNLLKYRDAARYREGEDKLEAKDCSGREAYRTYSATAFRKVREMGGSLLWSGSVAGCPIAPQDEGWDDVLLVKYPSISAFKKMLADPEYRLCTRHRTAALENARLIATFENESGGSA